MTMNKETEIKGGLGRGRKRKETKGLVGSFQQQGKATHSMVTDRVIDDPCPTKMGQKVVCFYCLVLFSNNGSFACFLQIGRRWTSGGEQ
jgi:hypothetical protein